MRLIAALLAVLLAGIVHADQSNLKPVTLNAATSTAVMPFNQARRSLRISNPGANPAACTTLATATATNGDPIPAGGSIVYEEAAYAIMPRNCFSTAGTTLVASEATRDGELSSPSPTPIPTPTPAPT